VPRGSQPSDALRDELKAHVVKRQNHAATVEGHRRGAGVRRYDDAGGSGGGGSV